MCEQDGVAKKSLASIIGEIQLLRIAYAHSDYINLFLDTMESEAHTLFELCEKCNMKGGEKE
jgi:hypothetical protein